VSLGDVTRGPVVPARFRVPLRDGSVLDLGIVTRVMGVLNVTPDSFSDGGKFLDAGDAVSQAERMLRDGADLIDVGGESTRPGAAAVDASEEIARVLPVVRRIKRDLGAIVSVDTSKSEVARAVLDEGADWINDVTSLADPEMAGVVAASGAAVVLMHMRGTPRTMQADTRYDDLLGTVTGSLRSADEKARRSGIPDDKILLDPGIGFGKSRSGNLELVRRLPELGTLGRPILVGASRKSFIGAVLDLPADDRLEGSLAATALAAWLGAHVVRVHDVLATVRAVRVVDAVRNG